MKTALIFLLLDIFSLTSAQSCQPDDEFETDETTPEWVDFMDKITNLTMNQVSELPCQKDPSKKVTIDANSDFLWDLRFTVYSERQETIEQCYQRNSTTCNLDEFRSCMKEVRDSMLTVISSSWWSEAVEEELAKMAQNC